MSGVFIAEVAFFSVIFIAMTAALFRSIEHKAIHRTSSNALVWLTIALFSVSLILLWEKAIQPIYINLG